MQEDIPNGGCLGDTGNGHLGPPFYSNVPEERDMYGKALNWI